MISKFNKINEKILKENNIFESEIQEMNNFCTNQNLLSNIEYDKNIKITNIIFKNKKFNMYVYKTADIVSNSIINFKNYEEEPTNKILIALNYFSKKKKIDNNNIYIIDIGANIGWYTLTLSKFGYKVISFEPSKLNYYILKKNYCINKELNITLINKGLYNEDKKCDLYNFKGNKGNAILKCDNNLKITNEMIKEGEIILTKLNNYLPFIREKNLFLIKVDAEGSEGKALEGGIELISQYHVPFIFMEFTPYFLELHGTDPIRFLQIFINNGYKISYKHFLDKKDYKIGNIIKKAGNQINLYITYKKVFEG